MSQLEVIFDKQAYRWVWHCVLTLGLDQEICSGARTAKHPSVCQSQKRRKTGTQWRKRSFYSPAWSFISTKRIIIESFRDSKTELQKMSHIPSSVILETQILKNSITLHFPCFQVDLKSHFVGESSSNLQLLMRAWFKNNPLTLSPKSALSKKWGG